MLRIVTPLEPVLSPIASTGAPPVYSIARGLLYGVEPNDPETLLTVVAVLMLVSAAACLIPACRAISVNPVAVLKAE